MKKAVVFCLTAYVFGILMFEILDASMLVFMCIAFILAVCAKCYIFRSDVKLFPLIVCGFFVFGVVYTSLINSYKTDGIRNILGQSVIVTGRIVKVGNNDNEFYDRYEIDVHNIKNKSDITVLNDNKRLKLSFKKYNQNTNLRAYNYGDVIEFEAKPTNLPMPLNEGEVNYARNSKADGIFFALEGEYDDSKLVSSDINYFNIRDIAHIARKYCMNVIDARFTGDDASLLKGMLLSERSFSDDYYRRLSDSGLLHITVASGLHATCVFTMVVWICFACYIKKKWTYSIAGVLLWAFAFLQGMTPSIIRAVIMLSFYMLAQLVGRDYEKEHILYITAFIMLLKNPYMIFDLGFILSFTSVLGIVLFKDIIDEYLVRVIRVKKISLIISTTVSVQILPFPILAYCFNKVSIYSIFSNLMIVPLLTIVLALGFAFVAFGRVAIISTCVSSVLGVFIKYINKVIYVVSELPFAKVDVFFISPSSIIIYYLILAAVYCYFTKGNRKYNFAYAAACIAVITCVAVVQIYTNSFMQVKFINVGQGDATLIKIPYGKTIVIDGGGSSPVSTSDLGEEIFVPYLRRNGVGVIDYAIVSHYDKDHAQGIAAALRLLKVKNLILPYMENKKDGEYKKIIEESAAQKQINVLYFKEGDSLKVGGALIEVFAPNEMHSTNKSMSDNEKSLVLKLTYGNTKFLFTGDIEEAAIGKLVKYEDKLQSDVIKSAHHGSAQSNLTKLIRTVSPQYAVISVGEDNIYDLPSKQTLRLFEHEGIRTYRTDEHGTVSFYVGKKDMKWIDTFYNK